MVINYLLVNEMHIKLLEVMSSGRQVVWVEQWAVVVMVVVEMATRW